MRTFFQLLFFFLTFHAIFNMLSHQLKQTCHRASIAVILLHLANQEKPSERTACNVWYIKEIASYIHFP